MTTWAMSPAYGRTVALGPAQRDVLRVVLHLTESGRRPELTLARLAALSGRPWTSVATALGRLRALGLIGVSARMGRHGGHRLWRVRARADRPLDAIRRRLAIARIVGRWGVATTQAAKPDPDPVVPGAGVPQAPRPTAAPGTPPPGAAGTPTQTPQEAAPSFGERLRREAERQGLYGLRERLAGWERDRDVSR